MNKSKEAGKGSADRTADFKRRDSNYDRIKWSRPVNTTVPTQEKK